MESSTNKIQNQSTFDDNYWNKKYEHNSLTNSPPTKVILSQTNNLTTKVIPSQTYSPPTKVILSQTNSPSTKVIPSDQ